MTDPKRITDLCEEAVRKFPPVEGKTFCNVAADYIATKLGCSDLKDGVGNAMTADLMFHKISNSEKWRPVTIGGTWVLANNGGLVLATASSQMLKEEHGHICTILPSFGVYSGHWDCQVPLCANVGKENFMGRPVSFAFREMPLFFVWKPSLESSDNDDKAS